MRRNSLIVALCLGVALAGVARAAEQGGSPPADAKEKPLVQLAILLDTSNSMDGLIAQAKTQLWSIVNEFATAKRAGLRPTIQVALYQYGTPSLGAENGFIRQVLPLTDDLDKVSDELFKLKTSGGEEFCGWVIKTATEELKWSPRNEDYKAIFIAGNEPFTQGKVDFRESCKAAIGKGIIVNTIHCAGGEDTGWADAPKLADGKFMRIDQDRAIVQIDAPQDKEIARLGLEMNKTYLAFGAQGKAGKLRQEEQEVNAVSAGAVSNVQRQVAKSSGLYNNPQWDLVDAAQQKDFDITNVKEEDLPENMKKMNGEERKAYVEEQRKKRGDMQKQIGELNAAREKYVVEEMKKRAGDNNDTLGEQVRSAVREQAAKKAFEFK